MLTHRPADSPAASRPPHPQPAHCCIVLVWLMACLPQATRGPEMRQRCTTSTYLSQPEGVLTSCSMHAPPAFKQHISTDHSPLQPSRGLSDDRSWTITISNLKANLRQSSLDHSMNASGTAVPDASSSSNSVGSRKMTRPSPMTHSRHIHDQTMICSCIYPVKMQPGAWACRTSAPLATASAARYPWHAPSPSGR